MTDEELRRLLDELPEREPRSRLDPFRALIMEMRRRQYSYRDISRFLIERCGVAISHNAVRNFINRHWVGIGEPQPVGSTEAHRVWNVVASSLSASRETEQPQPIRDRIDALKRRPQAGAAPDQPFSFDPAQPLRLPQD